MSIFKAIHQNRSTQRTEVWHGQSCLSSVKRSQQREQQVSEENKIKDKKRRSAEASWVIPGQWRPWSELLQRWTYIRYYEVSQTLNNLLESCLQPGVDWASAHEDPFFQAPYWVWSSDRGVLCRIKSIPRWGSSENIHQDEPSKHLGVDEAPAVLRETDADPDYEGRLYQNSGPTERGSHLWRREWRFWEHEKPVVSSWWSTAEPIISPVTFFATEECSRYN